MALTTPPTPTIGPPGGDCCPEPDPCDECCEVPTVEASIDIPANWGTLIYTGIPNLPAACWNPYESACVGGFPVGGTPGTCNGCDNITARTVLFDFAGAGGSACGATYTTCADSLYPIGTPCKVRYASWSDSFQCCSPSQFSGGTYQTHTGSMAMCASLGIYKHADDASCRIVLIIRQTIGYNCGVAGDNTVRGARVYTSDLISNDCCGTYTLTDSRTRSGTAIAGSCGDLCDSMPTSFDVTLTC